MQLRGRHSRRRCGDIVASVALCISISLSLGALCFTSGADCLVGKIVLAVLCRLLSSCRLARVIVESGNIFYVVVDGMLFFSIYSDDIKDVIYAELCESLFF